MSEKRQQSLMKFNELSYCCQDGDYLSIQLLIDGEPFDGLIEADNQAIPFYFFDKDILPKGYHDKDYLLGVCSCGDAGCGSVECEIIREKDCVIFRNFKYGHSLPKDAQFKFTHENYDSVMKSIIEKVKKYKLTTGRVNKYS